MADPIISYKRLSHAWATAVATLNFLIGKTDEDAVWSGSQFVSTNSDGKLEARTAFSVATPSAVTVGGNIGTTTSGIARGDHSHINTCPTPEADTHIANKLYVDNSVSGLVSGVRLIGSGMQILLPKTQAAIGEVVKITGNNTYAVTASGTNPDYAPIAVVASNTIEGTNNAWYAISGLAYVSFTSAPTAGQIARLSKSADPGAANGKATGVSVFSPPSASDDHWSEIGHVVSNVAVNGLYPVILHFN